MNIPELLTEKWPGSVWSYRGDAATAYDGLTWHGADPKPSEQELQTAWDAYVVEKAEAEATEAAQESAGISAMVASLAADDPDRVLNPAQVRFGFALLVKAIAKGTPLVLTEQQAADLNTGIQNLLTHLSE